MEWRKFNGEPLNEDLFEAVKNVLKRESEMGYRLKVCIGTDSQVRANGTDFATVIVFLREKRGGFMFISNEKSQQPFTLKERMLAEVSKSIQVAYLLCPILDEFKVEMEVHADINTNPNFNSNTALKEAMGYIMGMGFIFKAKPEAFASSCCADKVV